MSDVSAKPGAATPKDPSSGVVSVDWFPKPAPPAPEGHVGTLVRVAIGAAAGGVLWTLGHANIAYAAWGITAVVGGISLASPRARGAIARGLAWFGRAVGNVVGNVLLTIAYVLVIRQDSVGHSPSANAPSALSPSPPVAVAIAELTGPVGAAASDK